MIFNHIYCHNCKDDYGKNLEMENVEYDVYECSKCKNRIIFLSTEYPDNY